MSRPVVVAIPHQLGRAEARRRIEEGLDRLTSQIAAVAAVTSHWEADVLHFSAQILGQTVPGLIGVEESEVRLEVQLPGVLGMIAERVKGRFRREAQILLEPPKK